MHLNLVMVFNFSSRGHFISLLPCCVWSHIGMPHQREPSVSPQFTEHLPYTHHPPIWQPQISQDSILWYMCQIGHWERYKVSKTFEWNSASHRACNDFPSQWLSVSFFLHFCSPVHWALCFWFWSPFYFSLIPLFFLISFSFQVLSYSVCFSSSPLLFFF